MTKLEAEARVSKGIEYLNENHPGWLEKIDPWTLDIESNCNCVLGQIFGSYLEATQKGYVPLYWGQRLDCGFTGFPEKMDELTSAWRRILFPLKEAARFVDEHQEELA